MIFEERLIFDELIQQLRLFLYAPAPLTSDLKYYGARRSSKAHLTYLMVQTDALSHRDKLLSLYFEPRSVHPFAMKSVMVRALHSRNTRDGMHSESDNNYNCMQR